MRNIFLVLAILASSVVFAEEVSQIDCKAQTRDEQIFAQLRAVDFAAGKVLAYSMTIVLPAGGKDYGIVPETSTVTMSGKNLQSVRYNGRVYPGHVKFPMLQQTKAGNFTPDAADLIISPAYTVVKTVREVNQWDPTWAWDVEVRKHSAVLAANYDDHHGGYIKLDCYSTAHVNDTRLRN